MKHLPLPVALLLASCGAASAPASEHPTTTASTCSAPEAAVSIDELGAVLGLVHPLAAVTVTMVELDGVAPREAVVTGTVDAEGEHQADVFMLRRTDAGWARITQMAFPLGDPGTFEATPGATMLHVMPTEGCREAVFVRIEDASGGADPRELSVGVMGFALAGDDVARAWFCRTTTLVESGPDRATVSESERAITFDDAARTIDVVESMPTAGRSTYAYAGGRWSTSGTDVCARD
jgi:hypothetical protein